MEFIKFRKKIDKEVEKNMIFSRPKKENVLINLFYEIFSHLFFLKLQEYISCFIRTEDVDTSFWFPTIIIIITGSLFTIYAYITQIEKSILKELHAEYEEMYGIKPTCIFPGVNDNELTTQSGTIASLMKKLFNINAYIQVSSECV